MSDSVRPHRRQPTRLPRPWDSPGKNTGVGCHFLLQCLKMKSESEAAQSCPTLCDPMDCSPPGSSIHGILLIVFTGLPVISLYLKKFLLGIVRERHNDRNVGFSRQPLVFERRELHMFMDRGAWQTTVRGVAKSWTQLSN